MSAFSNSLRRTEQRQRLNEERQREAATAAAQLPNRWSASLSALHLAIIDANEQIRAEVAQPTQFRHLPRPASDGAVGGVEIQHASLSVSTGWLNSDGRVLVSHKGWGAEYYQLEHLDEDGWSQIIGKIYEADLP